MAEFCKLNLDTHAISWHVVQMISQKLHENDKHLEDPHYISHDAFHVYISGNIGPVIAEELNAIFGVDSENTSPVKFLDERYLISFLKREYNGCCFIDRYFGEIVTMLEQSIISKSQYMFTQDQPLQQSGSKRCGISVNPSTSFQKF